VHRDDPAGSAAVAVHNTDGVILFKLVLLTLPLLVLVLAPTELEEVTLPVELEVVDDGDSEAEAARPPTAVGGAA
jgi:hypothetical protein